ncbi:MAG: hypothetical protein KGS00_12005 [Alphaproteobacteria bacterium]|nr:hypothetical protein [Alphaproteobacteria bacterium]
MRAECLHQVALGFRAMRGGAVVVGVRLEAHVPCLVMSSFLPTAGADDRLAFEPYHVAAEEYRSGGDGQLEQIAALVAEGRRRQLECAVRGLSDMLEALRNRGLDPVIAGLLVNRAGWVSDLLTYSLQWADHPPVAEGLAVRETLRSAFGLVGLRYEEADETSLPDLARRALSQSSDDIDAHVRGLGREAGAPWRKEQKAACLTAWTSLATLQART